MLVSRAFPLVQYRTTLQKGANVFEVFNVRSGETIGYTDLEINALIALDYYRDRGIWADYINADEES